MIITFYKLPGENRKFWKHNHVLSVFEVLIPFYQEINFIFIVKFKNKYLCDFKFTRLLKCDKINMALFYSSYLRFVQ